MRLPIYLNNHVCHPARISGDEKESNLGGWALFFGAAGAEMLVERKVAVVDHPGTEGGALAVSTMTDVWKLFCSYM